MIAVLNMASKCPSNVNVASESKVSCKSTTREQKMKVIGHFNSGDRAVDIVRDMGTCSDHGESDFLTCGQNQSSWPKCDV